MTRSSPWLDSPAYRLLFACCYPKPDAALQQQQAALLAAGVDWAEVMQLAQRHRIQPLLYSNLRLHPATSVPDDVMAQLERQYLHNRRNVLRIVQATHQLRAQGVEGCILKGMDVAARGYRDIATRHAGDIDLWVPPPAVAGVSAILAACGWRTDTPELVHGGQARLLQQKYPDCTFTRPHTPRLELHWRTMRNPHDFPAAEHYWPQADWSHAGQTGMRGLPANDLLIYLCLHGSKHHWARLKWLFDLPNMLQTHRFDWPALWQRAAELHATLAVQQGLSLALRYFALPPQDGMTQGFRFPDWRMQWPIVHFHLRLPEAGLTRVFASRLLKTSLYRLVTRENYSSLLSLLQQTLHPNHADCRQLPLHGRWQYLYYPLRPLLWLRRATRPRLN